jgi:hypothetical protein
VPKESHRQWEYRVVSFPTEDAEQGLRSLNAAGDDGWEAVGVIPKALDESWVMLKREVVPDAGPERTVGFGNR